MFELVGKNQMYPNGKVIKKSKNYNTIVAYKKALESQKSPKWNDLTIYENLM
jgi:hypothetical protein